MADNKIPQTAELLCDIAEQIKAHGLDHEQLLQLADNELVVAHNLLSYIKVWAEMMLKKTDAYSQNAYNRMNKLRLMGADMLEEFEVTPLVYAQPKSDGAYAVEAQISMLRHAPIMVPESDMEKNKGETEE